MVAITNVRCPARLAALAACLLAACSGGDRPELGTPGTPGTPGQTSFETDWPSGESAQGASDSGLGAPTTGAAGNSGQRAGDGAEFAPNPDGARAIVEADIIQLHGDRLYALSRMTGLNVVDAADPANLKLLGTFGDTRGATPFEMYVRDDVALVMFTGWGKYVPVESAQGDDEPAYAWVQTSELVALDVSDPADIALLGSFEIPGAISDSRIVGDVLYVVGYQDGSCWNCEQNRARTVVVSVDVTDARAIAKVDELAFEDDDNVWGWNQRSITVTTERMYVAGPEYGNNGPVGSSIQVVDISDPDGDMALGAVVSAAGQISSRWQMDEHEGVLRVISQPPQWNLSAPPVIQTFTVTSSDEATPLGRADMRLPRPEQLQSVRFDGPRAYAITFERTDPLFTIDLSDPAAPRQVGELEIPGFVYHMEPRGDRVIGLGFDQGNAAGSITVSIFDVSDMAAPAMLDRVNFGGDWAYLPEDQDRIHKVFRVLDEHGLILVPHSGYEEAATARGECYAGAYQTGVQLVDFAGDDLTLRGALATRGEARRALLHEQHVLTVSDQEVASFDIADRAAPVASDSLALARYVTRALPMSGDLVARFSDDWWSDAFTIDFVAAGDAHLPDATLGQIGLEDILPIGDRCNGYGYVQDAFADGDRLVVFYEAEDWSPGISGKREGGVVVIDASDPAQPRVAGKHSWRIDNDFWPSSGLDTAGIPIRQRSHVRFDGGAAILEARWVQDSLQDGHEEYRVRVIDLRDPGNIGERTLDLPARTGYAGLRAEGTTIVTGHHEPVAGSDAARFYLDRIDVSDPSAPALLEPINVPGLVMHYDARAGYAVTMDLRRAGEMALDWQKCGERFGTFTYRYTGNGDVGRCVGYQQIVRLVSIDGGLATLRASHELPVEQALRELAAGDGRLVGTIGTGNAYYGGFGRGLAVDCFGPCGYYGTAALEPRRFLVLSGFEQNELRTGTIELSAEADPWYGWWGSSNLVAAGQRALVTSHGELAIIDLNDAEHPVIEQTAAFSGSAYSVDVSGNRVVLALGEQGCRVIDM